MKTLNELEIAKAYEGKPYIIEKVRKIATGTLTGATFYSRRIVQRYGHMIGITDEIFEKWWDDGIHVLVFMEFDDESQTIKNCKFVKGKWIDNGGGKFQRSSLTPTQEDLRIFHNAMEFITTN